MMSRIGGPGAETPRDLVSRVKEIVGKHTVFPNNLSFRPDKPFDFAQDGLAGDDPRNCGDVVEMKVPISWLKEYVTFDASPEEVARRLTFSGIEVEVIQNAGPDYEGVVVGEILTIAPHPDAGRFLLCRVSDGKEEFQVVCGARNFAVGDKAPLAKVGAVLPSGLRIEQKKVRGAISCGMLCAEDELQISDDHSGIMLLDRSIPTGTPFSKVAKSTDVVLELEVTWNRPDCLSIIGIAREVAALFGTKLRLPSVAYPESGEPIEKLATVSVRSADGCPRYTARVVSGIKPGPSPVWMQKRLSLCGTRPISNIVDVTNYVMLECGQPLHAFDHELLTNHEIVVRRAGAGEKMATLDGIERKITPQMLVIADARRPVALAGVMGGAGSEIRDKTNTVLLESACFAAPDIKRTSSALGLSTESSHRFERGVDIGNVDWASRRATTLMLQCAGGVAASGVIDVWPRKPDDRLVTCRFQRVRDLLGVDIRDEDIVSILDSLEIAPIKNDGKSCTVKVPSFRPDLELEADLIEEIARMHGLDKVPERLPQSAVVPDADDSRTRAVIALRTNLIGIGLSETMNYSFVSERLLNMFSPDETAQRVVLPNPVSADYAIMRDSLIPQMLESLGRNLFHQVADVSFFEIGKVFLKSGDGRIREEDRICIGLMGKVGRSGLDSRRAVGKDEAFLWMKGVLEALCAAQHVEEIKLVASQNACMEDGRNAAITIGGKAAGVMGLITQPIRAEWRMTEPVAVAELAVEPFISSIFVTPAIHAAPLYPSVSRDVAIIVGVEITHERILQVIWKNAPKELTAVRLFDIYTGDKIGVGKRSLAYSLVYRSLERTLTDEDANRYHDSIKTALKRELEAEIRES